VRFALLPWPYHRLAGSPAQRKADYHGLVAPYLIEIDQTHTTEAARRDSRR
jgi:hypothetical protein